MAITNAGTLPKTSTVDEKLTSPPSTAQLSELACILSKGNDQEPKALVKRALEIWNAAAEELSGRVQLEALEKISFDSVAESKMLPSARQGTGYVGTANGVKKGVIKYFEALLLEYDNAMDGRRINSGLLIANKRSLVQLRDEILEEKQVPSHVLNKMKKFQIKSRKGSVPIDAQDIRGVLGDVDIGQPSDEL
jgi:hypothetical protein